jgi:hypothetical protein
MSEYPPSFKHGSLHWEYPDPLDEDRKDVCALVLDPNHPMTIKNLETLTRMLKLMLVPVLNGR